MTPRPRSARQGDLFTAPIPGPGSGKEPPGGEGSGQELPESRRGQAAPAPPAPEPTTAPAPDPKPTPTTTPTTAPTPTPVAEHATATPLPPASLPLARRQLVVWQERLAAYQAPLWLGADRQDMEADTQEKAIDAAERGEGLPRGREAEQPSLFAGAEGLGEPAGADPAARARTLRPLALPAQNLSFWRWPQAPHQGPALYFVLDRPDHLRQPLLLYVGETARADRRWKGAHDCKSYLAAYQEALARADLEARLTIRFCCDAPAATGARRALEQALIQRWKPPFNKETRGRWNTPFTADLD